MYMYIIHYIWIYLKNNKRKTEIFNARNNLSQSFNVTLMSPFHI